eukprot:CAMPEP_0201543720 /NCGR_PEP_ID=MMETSP0161_2-20130828/72761_1 /ASSEMBLY_ACC=CAM_ASM_000251 /TAXON_ID=180227 /ORGANISM="Neoparamoeba aestuarina, Strain SoJaBio B1-5/56/2" /LENGTH=566 /DNA_ID=CAMNT_0047951543 /DNA_START=46 /DNA_END=1746 /DNA_ORIENTATION=-
MKLSLFLLTVALFASSLQAEKRISLEGEIKPSLPQGWRSQGRASPSDYVSLLINFKPENEEELHFYLYEAGSPTSPSYGEWWTKKQVDDLLKPSQENEDIVTSWLGREGVKGERVTNLWLDVRCKVEVAERLLDVQFERFYHHDSKTVVIRSLDHYTVPEEVSNVIQLVGNVNRFPKIATHPSPKFHDFVGKEDITTTTPASIQQMYNITLPPVNTSNVQAVVSFLDQYYKPSDLVDFQNKFGFPSGACDIVNTVGFNNESKPGTECSLDVQYLQFGNCTVATWDYSTPGSTKSGNEPFLNWLIELDYECTHQECPYVYSMSYQDYENTVSAAYARAVSLQFALITMTGRTFFTGSGDWGVGCKDIGYGPDSYSCQFFNPDFISTSPYVVSLGATTLNNGVEEAVTWSSGGFSILFDQPAYQKNAVSEYLARDDIPPTSYYNTNGRGFPDLAVIGTNFEVFLDGHLILVDGTSAATPTFAQMVSLLNTIRFNADMPPMGFVHPFLYESWEMDVGAFRDMTSNQPMEHGCCVPGFSCVDGWEPLNGLGVPDFGVLADLAVAAGAKRF